MCNVLSRPEESGEGIGKYIEGSAAWAKTCKSLEGKGATYESRYFVSQNRSIFFFFLGGGSWKLGCIPKNEVGGLQQGMGEYTMMREIYSPLISKIVVVILSVLVPYRHHMTK